MSPLKNAIHDRRHDVFDFSDHLCAHNAETKPLRSAVLLADVVVGRILFRIVSRHTCSTCSGKEAIPSVVNPQAHAALAKNGGSIILKGRRIVKKQLKSLTRPSSEHVTRNPNHK